MPYGPRGHGSEETPGLPSPLAALADSLGECRLGFPISGRARDGRSGRSRGDRRAESPPPRVFPSPLHGARAVHLPRCALFLPSPPGSRACAGPVCGARRPPAPQPPPWGPSRARPSVTRSDPARLAAGLRSALRVFAVSDPTTRGPSSCWPERRASLSRARSTGPAQPRGRPPRRRCSLAAEPPETPARPRGREVPAAQTCLLLRYHF